MTLYVKVYTVRKCAAFGLNISLNKCIVMKISWRAEVGRHKLLNNHEMKKVQSYKYIARI